MEGSNAERPAERKHMMDNYLAILEESLSKKLKVMGRIRAYNKEQSELFTQGRADIDKFDESIEEKGRLIEQLTELDDGFETLYARVAEELKGDRARYADQIKRLQQLVKQVTDESVAIQAEEARNKALIEEYFAKERAGLRDNRKSSKAAYDYYKSMSNTKYAPPQYMDSKQ